MSKLATTLAGLMLATTANAHFIFIVPASDGSANIILSETPSGEDAVAIQMADGGFFMREHDGSEKPLVHEPLDEKRLRLALDRQTAATLHGEVDLGVMTRGSAKHRLIYYPKTLLGDPSDAPNLARTGAPVELAPVAMAGQEGPRLVLLVADKPKGESEITLIQPDGESRKVFTDENGLTEPLAKPGRYGAWARHWEDTPGTYNGDDYAQVRRYATLVLDVPEPPQPAVDKDEALITRAERRGVADEGRLENGGFRPMPYAASSFGAVALDGWLYLYGGHIAPTHNYHTQSASGAFHRLDLSQRDAWQPLPGGPRLQGMNLAVCDGAILRVGGMQSFNSPDEPTDNRSTNLAERFDPAHMAWSPLAPLPEPRSSHDVVVSGRMLYVIGGWNMHGREQPSTWLEYVDVLDLGQPDGQWVRIPQPFRRRALIAAVLDQRLFAIGGFVDHKSPSLDVDVFDLRTSRWSKGPSLPEPQRNGFAPAACVVDRRLYVSLGDGSILRLSASADAWEPVAQATPRIVHRLVPFGANFLILGGASGADILDLIESVSVGGTSGAAAQVPPGREDDKLAIVSRDTRSVVDVSAASPANGAIANGQRYCPIMTGDRIGGNSPTVDYRGHVIALCCETCALRWKRDPDAYAAASAALLPQLAGEQLPPRELEQRFCPVYRDRVVTAQDIVVEYQGRKVYLFNDTALERWNADPAKYADPGVLPQLAEPLLAGDEALVPGGPRSR